MLIAEAVHSILLAFSVYTNGQKMLKISDNSGQILCINGIKVLSMLWVITGHRFIQTAGGVLNPSDTVKVLFDCNQLLLLK